MVNENKSDSPKRNEDLPLTNNILNRFQIFFDNNIQIIRHVSWMIGGIGLIIIIKRTYALHHFTTLSSIPENYFMNNVTLTGKVVNINRGGCLGILHLPLLWKTRINYTSNPDPNLLNVNVTGVELHSGGLDYLNTQLINKNVKFQLLGKDNCDCIESIVYHKKSWLRRKSSVNEDIIRLGFGKTKHVPILASVKAYDRLLEKLVRAEVKAVRKRSGIWKDDVGDGILYKAWLWLKNKMFKC